MRCTAATTGKSTPVLQLVSASSAHPSTFVLREVRELRGTGLEMSIGQVRPVFKKMNTVGFSDLDDIVVRSKWIPMELIAAVVYWSTKQPQRLRKYLSLIHDSGTTSNNFLKMLFVLISSLALAYRFRKRGVGHIRAHFLHTEALAAYFVSGMLRAPYSITVHTVATYYPPKVIDAILGNASFIVADTHQVVEFVKALGVPADRLSLIRNGIPFDELEFRDKQKGTGPPIILAAGYLSPKKGFAVLFEACAILAKHHVQFRCVVIGDGSDRERLTRLREELGLQNQVGMLGDLSIDDLRDWYYKATIFVMPSVIVSGETDGLPTVVLEALACGTPVIGTNVAGIPEVISNGKTGILIEAGSYEALAENIELLFSHEPLRKSLALQGRKAIERDFDLQRTSRALAGLIRDPRSREAAFVS